MKTINGEGRRIPTFKMSGRKFKYYYYNEEGHIKRDCPKKELRDEKSLVVGFAKGSYLGDGGDNFLRTAESPEKSD